MADWFGLPKSAAPRPGQHPIRLSLDQDKAVKRSWGWMIGLGYRRGSAAPRPGQRPDTISLDQDKAVKMSWGG